MAAVAAADSAAEKTAATAVAAATEAAAATKRAGAIEGVAAIAPLTDAQRRASSFADSVVNDIDDNNNDNVAVGGGGGCPPHKVVIVNWGSTSSRKQPRRPLLSDNDVVNVGGCGGRENDNVSPPSAFPIPASGGDVGGDVGGNVGGSGNNNNSGMNDTNMNMLVRRRRKMYSEST